MKKKEYKVLHCLDMGIYPGTIMFSCGFTYDEIINLLNESKSDDWINGIEDDRKLIEAGNYLAFSRDLYKKGGKNPIRLYYIIIPEFKFTDYEMCKLAHEVLHICQFHLPDILDRNREFESEAYLHTHIMMQCLKILRNV